MQKTLLLLLLLLVSMEVKAQNYITPQQAIQAVRLFTGDAATSFVVYSFSVRDNPLYNGDYFGSGACYSLRVKNQDGIHFTVHATDGIVLGYETGPQDLEPGEQPAVTRQQAQAIAEQFARQHYPETNLGAWQLCSEREIMRFAPYEFRFAWRQILDPRYGTLHPHALQVSVEAKRGVVFRYQRPRPMTITLSPVPRLSAAQVKQVATPFALYDVGQAPFTPPVPQIEEDMYGVQYLVWELRQYPYANTPASDFATVQRIYQVYDATGLVVDASRNSFAGGDFPVGPKSNKNRQPLPVRKAAVYVRKTGGAALGSVVPPILKPDHVWLRVELLRGLGCEVQITRASLRVQTGGHVLTQSDLMARWQEQGWWVPLARAADKAGWKVTWLPVSKEAVVDVGSAQRAVQPTPFPGDMPTAQTK